MNQNEDIICGLLNCKVEDISYIRNCKYSIRELAEWAFYQNAYPADLKDICDEIFKRGLVDLHNIQQKKYAELKTKHDPCSRRVGKLWSFKDISYETDCKRPHIYFVKNEDDWRAFFNNEIERVEDEMGFRIGHSEEFIKGQEALAEEQRDAMTDVFGSR